MFKINVYNLIPLFAKKDYAKQNIINVLKGNGIHLLIKFIHKKNSLVQKHNKYIMSLK